MPGVGIIGTGFMGMAHTEALRRLGHDVVGIVGSSPERARAKAAASDIPLPPVFETVDELVAAVEVVHVTSPNHVHAEHVRAVLAAGRHVVCEKPLGVSSAETAELVTLAEAAGVVHAVCFNIRHYPQNQHAAALVRAGAVGEPRFVTGRYHQDWLLLDTDWNWRLDTARQGGLRAVADIGSHWLDLTRFVSGRQVVEVFADLHTFVTERNHPVVDVESFAAVAVDVERVREHMESDDAASLLLRFDDGLRGACTISQVSAGRRNTIEWELAGSTRCAGVGVGGSGATVDGPSPAAQRDRREGPCADGRRLPAGSRRGVPGHVPRSVRRGLPRHRHRRTVATADLSDVRRRPRRRAGVRGDQRLGPLGHVDEGGTNLRGAPK